MSYLDTVVIPGRRGAPNFRLLRRVFCRFMLNIHSGTCHGDEETMIACVFPRTVH